MKKQYLCRGLLYCFGICLISIGITLNTMTGLGLSPVTAVPFAVSKAFSITFPTAMCGYYIVCCLVQVMVKGKESSWKEYGQVPASFVFSAVQGQFARWMAFLTPQEVWHSWVLLPFAVLFTGFGVALIINMELVPNPADGIPVVVSRIIHKSVGLSKNMVDAGLFALTLCIDLVFSGGIISLGAGTVAGMIGNGRAVALFDHLFQKKVKTLAGLLPAERS